MHIAAKSINLMLINVLNTTPKLRPYLIKSIHIKYYEEAFLRSINIINNIYSIYNKNPGFKLNVTRVNTCR